MTPAPDRFPDLTEAGEHALPASFFGLASSAARVRVLVGAGDAALLSDAERRRADTFGSDKRRDEFVRGRSLVRRIVAERTGSAPQEVRLETAPGGGFLPLGDGLHVSLTHTARLAAAALVPHPVGLDAEHVRPVPFDLAARLLAGGEEPPDTDASLLHVWAAKEAVLKATGQGIRGGLRTFGLEWREDGDGLLCARALVAGRLFRVSVRSHADVLWAIALPETGAGERR